MVREIYTLAEIRPLRCTISCFASLSAIVAIPQPQLEVDVATTFTHPHYIIVRRPCKFFYFLFFIFLERQRMDILVKMYRRKKK